MSLLSNLRERRAERVATAIPAISATRKGEGGVTVARIATVAVANVPEDQPEKAITAFRWLIHFTDRETLTVTFSPEATHREVLASYAGAVAAEPMPVGHIENGREEQ